MKKYLLILFLCIFLLTGCIRSYSIDKKNVRFDEAVDFRHIHYRISDSFDYGSDDSFKSYQLYGKKNKVIYSITVNKKNGSMEDDIQSIEKKYKIARTRVKKNRINWELLEYREDKVMNHIYYASYNDSEYYRIDFYNADIGSAFEKQFIKNTTIDREK